MPRKSRFRVVSYAQTVVLGLIVPGFLGLGPVPAVAGWTNCSNIVLANDFDWAEQWTSTDSTYPFYHPSSGTGTCPEVGLYTGWVGIEGAVQTLRTIPTSRIVAPVLVRRTAFIAPVGLT